MVKNYNYIELLKDILIIFFIALPPWIVLKKYLKTYINRVLFIILFIIYITLTILTQQIVPFIAVILIFYFISKEKDSDEIYYLRPLESKKKEVILYSIGFKFLIMFINSYIVILLYKFGFNPKAQDIFDIFMKSGWFKILFLVIITSIAAPIVEEFVFRHIIYRKLKKRIGVYVSAIISSLLFALLHFNMAGSMAFFAVGIFNCYLYEKYGYRAAVINHFVFNFTSVIAIIIIKFYGIPNM
ncbi:MAG: CPBP family intramembrane metalloprotease [Caloramator sp.]|nr:CPBP family intramembrane metalloprotease [Caloramator sp.]